MQIILHNVGKRFNRDWIFRHVHLNFEPSKRYAIIGTNGSGKSTLLQILAGAIQPIEGTISWMKNDLAADAIDITAIAAPYLELIEELNALELLDFHRKFKTLNGSNEQILTSVGLANAAEKMIVNYSSGMKQRLKLALVFFSNAPVLLFDEPFTNLDRDGIAIFQQLMDKLPSEKTVIISSNVEEEYAGCTELIRIADYK